MGDPIGVGDSDRDRVSSPDEQVAGVEAEPDPRPGEHPLRLVAALDHRADVGVQRRGQAAGGHRVVEPVEVGQQGGPARLVELGPGVVALRPRGRSEDDRGRAGREQPSEGCLDVGERVVVRVVEQHGHELADGGQTV